MYQEENKIKNLLLTSSLYIKQKEYWVKKLSGAATGTTPLVHPVKPFEEKHQPPGKNREEISIHISDDLCSAIMKLCKNTDLSLYLILLTVLESLIYHYTDDEDILLLSPLYKIKITGDTLNQYLLIRQQFVRGMTFKELLLELKQSVFEAYQNQDYPIDALIEFLYDSEQIRDKNFRPKIECLLQNIHHYDDKDYQDIKDRLVFSFQRRDAQISGNILYNPAVYEKFYLEQAAKHFVNILEQVLENVNVDIHEISFLAPEERQQLIHDFNNTITEFTKGQLTHEIFVKQVERTPDHIALVGPLKMKYRTYMSYMTYISYKELNDRSNRMAHFLKEKGVGPDTIVAIMEERSPWMITALWAVLKAGGGYLPIDSEYPEEWIKYMLEDSGTKILFIGRDKSRPYTPPAPDTRTRHLSGLHHLHLRFHRQGKRCDG